MYDETAELTTAVTSRLTEILHTRIGQATAIDGRVGAVTAQLADFLGGGKRIRPQCCWWGYRAGGGSVPAHPRHPVVRLGAALELLQGAALIHDDIIDRSETRRGAPSVHRANAAHHGRAGFHGDADHFGLSIGVLLGDLALAWADDEFTALGLGVQAGEIWSAMRTEVLGGQLLDLIGAADSTLSSQAQIDTALTVMRYKTASYTIRRPLELGAVCAGATAPVLAQLAHYGMDVGVAFQLRDDVLGIFGDPARTGKPAGDDLTEGKMTLLFGWARQATQADPAQQAVLTAALGSTDPDLVAQATAVMAAAGAEVWAEQEIATLVQSATAALTGLTEPAAAALHTLAIAATNRDC